MRRLPSFIAVAALAAVVLTCTACGGDKDVRTVADFDDNPCGLFTDDVFAQILAAPYQDLASVEPVLKSAKASVANDETYACVYSFEAKGQPEVAQVKTMTVTVGHAKNGSVPFSICSAGAQTKADGYHTEKIGDLACLSPSSDLWMKIGDNYFHVVLVPQPGFQNPVEARAALSPLILTVAQATADRMPKT